MNWIVKTRIGDHYADHGEDHNEMDHVAEDDNKVGLPFGLYVVCCSDMVSKKQNKRNSVNASEPNNHYSYTSHNHSYKAMWLFQMHPVPVRHCMRCLAIWTITYLATSAFKEIIATAFYCSLCSVILDSSKDNHSQFSKMSKALKMQSTWPFKDKKKQRKVLH